MAAREVGPLVVIVGETASGKSALAMMVAQKFNGEIIAADSRTVYKEMNVGTAKPSKTDQARVPHHLIDITTPDKSITVADFKERATRAISDITARGKLPILVGGSGLYVDAVIFDFQFRPVTDSGLREKLSKLSVQDLQTQLETRGIPLPENRNNPRHLIRTLEANGEQPVHKPLRENTLVIGLRIGQEALQQQITQRVNAMVAAGLVEEVRQLAERYGPSTEALQAPGYKAFYKNVSGDLSLDEARRQFVKNDLQLAKRQRTWFKRNESIHWVRKQSDAVDLITTFLNK